MGSNFVQKVHIARSWLGRHSIQTWFHQKWCPESFASLTLWHTSTNAHLITPYPMGGQIFKGIFFCNSYWRFRFRSRKNTINWTYPNSPSVFWFLSYLTHFFWENWKKKDSLGSFLQGIWICNQNCKKITLKISPPPKEWAFVVVRHLARGMKISALHLWWSQFWIKCRPSHDRAKCTFLDQVPNHGTKKNWTSIHSQ